MRRSHSEVPSARQAAFHPTRCRKLACKKPQNHARYHLGKPMANFKNFERAKSADFNHLGWMEELDG
jgi:hypothetical protein